MSVFGRVIGIICGAALVGYCAAHSASSPPETPPDNAAWLRQNGDNPRLLDEKFGNEATAACDVGATEYLRSLAAHDFAWDDDAKGFFGDKFDHYSKLSAGNGLLTLITRKAKLSNGFGAFSHISVYCVYDAAANKVSGFYQIDPTDVIPAPPQTQSATVAEPTIMNQAVADQPRQDGGRGVENEADYDRGDWPRSGEDIPADGDARYEGRSVGSAPAEGPR